jgi:hypothetical protein
MYGTRFAFASVMALTSVSVFAQGNATQCPKVAPKSPQEVVMMAAGSNKQGCWVRDKHTGQLVFISNLSPNQSYKPLWDPSQAAGCKPVLRTGATPGMSALLPGTGLAGTWKSTSGVWPGDAELALIRQFGKPGELRTINGCPVTDVSSSTDTVIRTPAGGFCSAADKSEPCLSPSGTSSYTSQSGTNRCTYELEGSTLRGACTDLAIPGRIVLVVATKAAP